jgi:uncharacterized radical SAM protein YgiQ
MAFLPVTKKDIQERGWSALDVIFVSGDAYIDHPSFGVPLLARLLEANGFRVGIIPQPAWQSGDAFTILGKPRLFFAVSGGSMDSMVAHYTPARKVRSDDAYTPGNRHGARPNRAVIAYTSRIKHADKGIPVVIGGIEASLRRFAHYDYWEDKVRRSILFDSKADMLIYGMGEHPILELAVRMRQGEPILNIRNIKGTAFICNDLFADSGGTNYDAVELPSFESVAIDKINYAEAFRLVSQELNPYCSSTIVQRHGERYLFCNPPSLPLSAEELDALYGLPFEKAPHPSYKESIPAYEQIKASITSHRGCFGGCAFCAISQHQGKIIQSRSEKSVIREIEKLTEYPWFKGSVSDVGGPTANMYGLSCGNRTMIRKCRRASCLFPAKCRHLSSSGKRAAALLRCMRTIKGVNHISVSSGVRYDLMEGQSDYFHELFAHHVGGLLKVAPEHLVDRVTTIMRKPAYKSFNEFRAFFKKESHRLGKKQYIVPYLISGHPGCTMSDMVELALMLKGAGLRVEQVQDFTPTPGTLSTCMYYTGFDPFSGEALHIPRGEREKRLQKALLLYHLPENRKDVLLALKTCGREKDAQFLIGSVKPSNTRGRASELIKV